MSWRLDDNEVKSWLEALMAGGKRVVAPVDDGRLRVFRPLEKSADAALDGGKTQWSPKEFLFPRTEPLLTYRVEGDTVDIEDAVADDTAQVLFGMTPCDAAGLARLGAVLGQDEIDPLFTARRNATTVVSIACSQAGSKCFCTAVGGAPNGEEGSDVQLARIDGKWIVRALTEKGEALLAGQHNAWTSASKDDAKLADLQAKKVTEQMNAEPLAPDLGARLQKAFESPVWAETSETCFGCSICTYVCPSCSCFDVWDEGDASCSVRCRSWDSCSFGTFTKHATGHNPRENQPARYRQRVLHKFAYFPAQHGGELMCIGCGRCGEHCPAGLGILATVKRVSASQGGEHA